MFNRHSDLFDRANGKEISSIFSFSARIVSNPMERRAPASAARTDVIDQLKELTWLLREQHDAQYDIVSVRRESGPPDNKIWCRDASQAKLSPTDSHKVDSLNMLLRSISRLKPILYAIHRVRGAYPEDLLQKFQELLQAVETSNPNLTTLESDFNKELLKALTEAGLASGISSQKKGEALLSHYRNLSALMEPTLPVQTITYDAVAGVLHRETNRPVTVKSQKQIEDIRDLRARPASTAIDQASQLFADLEISQDRMLPAQARKTHPIGAKNAFVVTTELYFLRDEQKEELKERRPLTGFDWTRPNTSLTLGRLASPVYVGSGPHRKTRIEDTRQNLEQMQRASGKQSLHLTVLNTHTPINKESLIVSTMEQAAKGTHGLSYTPANFEGTLRRISIDPSLQLPLWGSAPMQKKKRLETISEVMRTAAGDNTRLSVVNCASGQDRTGTAVHKATEDWMRQQYVLQDKDSSGLSHAYAKGGNAAEITSHLVTGSPGMKSVSKANNTFGKGKAFDDEVSSRLYLSSANTNKSSKLKDFTWFKQMAHLGILAALDNQIAEIRKMEDFQNPEVQAVLHDIEALKRPDLSLKEQKLLLSIAETVHQTLKNTGNTELTQSNLKKLEGLALQFGNKDPKWIALGVGLVVLASAIAVTAGILLPGFGLALAVLFVGLLGASSARMGVFSLKHNTSTQEISLVSNLDKLVEKTRTSPGPGQR